MGTGARGNAGKISRGAQIGCSRSSSIMANMTKRRRPRHYRLISLYLSGRLSPLPQEDEVAPERAEVLTRATSVCPGVLSGSVRVAREKLIGKLLTEVHHCGGGARCYRLRFAPQQAKLFG